jgi:hypothetical protein
MRLCRASASVRQLGQPAQLGAAISFCSKSRSCQQQARNNQRRGVTEGYFRDRGHRPQANNNDDSQKLYGSFSLHPLLIS